MQTLKQSARNIFFLWLMLAGLLAAGCSKSASENAIESDANGYLCLSCGAKLYTPRSVFIDPNCPSCRGDKLMPVVAYYCEKDKHLTIRPSRNDPQGTPVCELCKTPLQNAMRMPHQKDLEAWGAKKAQ